MSQRNYLRDFQEKCREEDKVNIYTRKSIYTVNTKQHSLSYQSIVHAYSNKLNFVILNKRKVLSLLENSNMRA